jgi:hypothetical protein
MRPSSIFTARTLNSSILSKKTACWLTKTMPLLSWKLAFSTSNQNLERNTKFPQMVLSYFLPQVMKSMKPSSAWRM